MTQILSSFVPLALLLLEVGTVTAFSPVYSSIFKRECPTAHVKCLAAVCPTCGGDEVCSITNQTCEQCPKAQCILFKSSSGGSTGGSSSGGGGAGPIAGGVIGGFVVLGLVGFFIWRNMQKKQKEREAAAEKEASFGSSRAARASTHTVASMSSTTTRASNVIQIGYLPGVMNRSAPSTPGQFIPPVPPLPGGTPEIRYPQSPDHGTFFSADDILRSSIITTDHRASVATTIYGGNAIVSPVAANLVRAGKAAVVTVKSGQSAVSTPQLGSTPPIPTTDFSQYEDKKDEVPASPAFSVGSTFLNKMSEKNTNARAAKKDDKNRLSVPRRVIPGRAVTAEAVVVESSVWEVDSSDDENEHNHRRRTLDSAVTSEMDMEDSPFSDTASISDIPLPAGAGLPPILTSSGSKAGRVSVMGQGKGKDNEDWKPGSDSTSTSNTSSSSNVRSPFDDANAVGRR